MKRKILLTIILIESVVLLLYLNMFTQEREREIKNLQLTQQELIEQNAQLENDLSILQTNNDKLTQSNNDLQESNNELLALNEKISQDALSFIEPLKNYSIQDYLTQYKIITNESMYNYYTESEINYMCRCIETEVYGCGFNEKCNIASVIINRIKDARFPNDAISVVTSPSQFAYSRTNISESTRLALEYVVLFGDTTNGCIGFRSDANPQKWNGWTYIFSDNAVHYFYK